MADLTNLITNFFPQADEAYLNNLSAGISAGATTVPVNSAAAYEEGDVVTLTVDPNTAKEATFVGVRSGNAFVDCVWTEGDLSVSHDNGAVIADYISATHLSIVSKGLLVEHNQDGTHKASMIDTLKEAIFENIYPVGSIYTNASNSANPSTLLGFGTWAVHGAGRVNVGIDPTQVEFDTAGETGGAKTHTLTTAQLPAHSHGVSDPGHSHTVNNNAFVNSSSTNRFVTSGSAQQVTWGNQGTTSSGTGISITNTGSGQAHNILQPYVVVYMWKRTA